MLPSSWLVSDFGLAQAEKAWLPGDGVPRAVGFTLPFVSPTQSLPLSREGWPAELGRELEGEVGFEDRLELPGEVGGTSISSCFGNILWILNLAIAGLSIEEAVVVGGLGPPPCRCCRGF